MTVAGEELTEDDVFEAEVIVGKLRERFGDAIVGGFEVTGTKSITASISMGECAILTKGDITESTIKSMSQDMWCKIKKRCENQLKRLKY